PSRLPPPTTAPTDSTASPICSLLLSYCPLPTNVVILTYFPARHHGRLPRPFECFANTGPASPGRVPAWFSLWYCCTYALASPRSRTLMPGYSNQYEQHRRPILKALLWITLCGGLFFSAVNLLHDNWLLAGLEIGYAAVSLYLLCVLDRTRNLQLLTAIYLVPFFSIMIVALAQTHTSFAVFAWIQSIPIICYL